MADVMKKVDATTRITISKANMQVAEFHIIGTAPYVQNRFGAKAIGMIREAQEAGSTNKKGKKKEPKDFMALYEDAKHKAVEGWCGIPATAFRNACVSACRIAGFQMTRAKLSIFVLPDSFDAEDGTPLVKITKGGPEYVEHAVRIAMGSCDLRPRPMWRAWEATVRMSFDADQFTLTDVANLMQRVGLQVGIGEGRADSKSSCGMGWGHFRLAEA